MGKITFFDRSQEGEPDNGLGKPHAELRDWTGRDERRLTATQDLMLKYPEGFLYNETNAIIEAQRRAIYPEAFDSIASAQYVDRNTKPIVRESVPKERRVIHHRILDVMHSLGAPREMEAPRTNCFGKTKLKRVKTPGHSRSSVRDMLREIMREL